MHVRPCLPATLLTPPPPQYLDQSAFRIVNGAVEETTALLKLKFDHIFYTGSGKIAKIILRAAAEHLTPTTLELGGKSPACVLDDADVYKTARRLMWGKWTNAGQICIAPDYVMCTEEMQPKLIAAFRKVLDEFNPADKEGHKTPAVDGDGYASLVSDAQYQRIEKLIDATKGTIEIDGGRNPEKRKIGTTVVTGIKPDDILMQGEQQMLSSPRSTDC